jgi:hypothetical protein
VTAAITDGSKRIEGIREEASSAPIKIGEDRGNGLIYRSAAERRLQSEVDSHAQRQLLKRIIEVRNGLDQTVPPVIKVMQRASQSAQTLSARYFDRISCLSRFSAGLGKLELAQLKASFALFVRGMAPIELHRLAQNAIDDITTPQSLVLLNIIRVENFGRTKDERAFENAKLLNLIPVPEFDQAQPLLQQVVDAYNAALTAWVDFNGQINRGANLRIGHALGKQKLAEQTA